MSVEGVSEFCPSLGMGIGRDYPGNRISCHLNSPQIKFNQLFNDCSIDEDEDEDEDEDGVSLDCVS